ncbi:MAG: hypothetical protein AAGN35_16955 [Bacteroidota bacterium]
MRKRKLFLLLAIMHPQDRDGFGTLLASTWFNNSPQLLRFWKRWRRYLEELPEVDPSPAEFLADTDIMPRRMNRLCSELKRKAEEFLALQEQESKVSRAGLPLLRALYARNAAPDLLLRYVQEIHQQLQEEPVSSRRYFEELELHIFEAEIAIGTRRTRDIWNRSFADLHHRLDLFYRLQKLKFIAASVNGQHIYHQQSPPVANGLSADMVAEIEAGEASPICLAYYHSIGMHTENNRMTRDVHFTDLMDLLDQHAAGFERVEAMDLFGYASNFCIRRANEGQREYLAHAATLYRQMLNTGLALVKGRIPTQRFKNMVTLHCRLGMLDWAERFIADYSPYIAGPNPALHLEYNTAVLAFHQADYARARDLLKKNITRNKDDVFYGIDARTYLWKAYFEDRHALDLQEVDEMFRLYDSFRIFIDRNQKISRTHRDGYRNFIREFKRFAEILQLHPVPENRLRALRDFVSEQEFMVNKPWFLEKIDQELRG